MIDKILTLHPDKTKQGVSIDVAKYDQVKKSIIKQLQAGTEHTFATLFNAVNADLDVQGFEGKPGWYMTTVKLDLEARGVLAHDRKTRRVTLI